MAQDAGGKFSKVEKRNFPSTIKIVSRHLAVTWQDQMKMTQAV